MYNEIQFKINILIKFIFYLIIVIYLSIQLLLLTKFIFNYFYYKNYGNLLKKICLKKNNEFETDRFQIYTNINKFNILNEKNNNINYHILLSIILIYGIIYGIILCYILYNFLTNIIHNSNNDLYNIFYYILLYSSCIIVIGYIPYYIGIKFNNISNTIVSYIDNYLLKAFGILSFIILIINYKNPNNLSFPLLFTVILCFNIIVYYIKKFIEMYKNIIIVKNNDYKLKEDFDLVKNYLIDIFGIKYYIEQDINKEYNLNFYIYLIEIFLISLILLFLVNNIKNIFIYFKDFNIEKLINSLIYKNNFNSNYLLYNPKDSKFLYNILSYPLIIILILFIIIYSLSLYNSYFNKYIINKPKKIYENQIKKVEKEFNLILYNESSDDDTYTFKRLERNIANSILLVLYNDLFAKILMKDDKEYIDDYKKYIEHINIVPEFKYDFVKKIKNINYETEKEYNIDYYLNNKSFDKKNNIFFKKINKNFDKKKICDDNDNIENKRYILIKIFENLFKNKYTVLEDNTMNDKDKDVIYKKDILKYKIYISIENINNDYNYLGDNKLDKNNNIDINNKIDKEFDIVKIDKNYAIGDNEINICYSNEDKDKNCSDLNKKINNIKKKLKIDDNFDIKIDEIINNYNEYILNMKYLYNGLNKGEDEEDDDDDEDDITMSVSNDSINDVINGLTISNIDYIKDRFEVELCKTFNGINKKFNNFYKYENIKNKLEDYIVNNYNLSNNENLEKIKKIDTNLEKQDDKKNDDKKNINIFFSHILVNIFINHKIITFIDKYYSISDIDSILNIIKENYDESTKEKYIKYMNYLYVYLVNLYGYNKNIIKEIKLNKYDKNEIGKEILNEYTKENIINMTKKYTNNSIDIDIIDYNINSYINENFSESNSNTINILDEFDYKILAKHDLNKIIEYLKKEDGDVISNKMKEIEKYYEMFKSLQFDILELLHNGIFEEINFSRILNNYKYFEKFEQLLEAFNKDTYIITNDVVKDFNSDNSEMEDIKRKKIDKNIAINSNININTINRITVYIIVIYIILIYISKYI